MSRYSRRTTSGIAKATALVGGFALVAMVSTPAYAATATVYDSMPSPYPPHFVSQPFQAEQTSEFGDQVTLAGTNRILEEVTVSFTSWACESGVWNGTEGEDNVCTTTPGSSFVHPIALNIYAANADPTSVLPGALLATLTDDVTVPFRPSAGGDSCPDNGTQWYDDTTDACWSGLAFNWTFDLSDQNVTLPDDIIVAIAYNTGTYGAEPIGTTGPWDALNVSVATEAPTVGSENHGEVFWDTETAALYGDGGTAGVGILRRTTFPDSYGGMVMTITAGSPEEPGLAETGVDPAVTNAGTWIGGGALAAGIVLVGFALYRKRAARD